MEASIVDLRYKTSEILKALDRNESVSIFYHGKLKGVIKPVKDHAEIKVSEHPFFSMNNDDSKESVLEELENLRKSRYDV